MHIPAIQSIRTTEELFLPDPRRNVRIIPLTLLLSWLLMVGSLTPILYPYQSQSLRWDVRERFLHQEFCEFNATRLRRDGVEAKCVYVRD